jgi:hypothetical protein
MGKVHCIWDSAISQLTLNSTSTKHTSDTPDFDKRQMTY